MNSVIKYSVLFVVALYAVEAAFCATEPVGQAVEALPRADYPKPGTPEWEARRARFMIEPGELRVEKVPTKKHRWVNNLKKNLRAVGTSPAFWMIYATALGASINYEPDPILNKWFSAKMSAAIGGGTAAAVGYLVGNAVGAFEGEKYGRGNGYHEGFFDGEWTHMLQRISPPPIAKEPFMLAVLRG